MPTKKDLKTTVKDTKKIPTEEQIRLAVQEAQAEWVAENMPTTQHIKIEVRKRLDEYRDKIINSVAGFSFQWDRVEIDHCNGRMTTIDAVIREHAAKEISDWLKSAFDGELPKLTTAQKKAISNEFMDKVSREVRERAHEYGERLAQDIIADAVAVASEPSTAISQKALSALMGWKIVNQIQLAKDNKVIVILEHNSSEDDKALIKTFMEHNAPDVDYEVKPV